ncbi:unnamed protein product [Closterium sp. NIES-64]|nr:unnamed protein product [Closterium sp. NIES-64]
MPTPCLNTIRTSPILHHSNPTSNLLPASPLPPSLSLAKRISKITRGSRRLCSTRAMRAAKGSLKFTPIAQTSAVVQDAMGRFTRAVRAAKGPLTLTAMVRAWNKHARAAVMHVLAASAPPNVCWHAVVGPWHECAADVAHG